MAKGKGRKCLRQLTALLNVFFLGVGVVMVILGSQALNKTVSLEDNASLFKVFNLYPLSLILLLCGCGTIATAFAGFYGAKFHKPGCLKAYAIILTVIIGLEFFMAGYMAAVKADQVRDEWFQDDGIPTTPNSYPARDQRVQVQNALGCCGFDFPWDSLLTLPPTPCTFSYPPGPCRQAFDDYIASNIGPVATAALAFAAAEVVALICTCVIIFGGSQGKEEDEAFHY